MLLDAEMVMNAALRHAAHQAHEQCACSDMQRVKPMNLFTRRELIEVAKQRVSQGNVETGINTNRGAALLSQLKL